MNLICFPTYCAGALISDLLNYQKSTDNKFGTIINLNADRLKVPYNQNNTEIWYRAFFNKKVKSLDLNLNEWVGTHCWPTEVDTSPFSKVLVISTRNIKSRIYRLIRIYFLYENLHKRYNFTDNKLENLEKKLNEIDFSEFKFNFEPYEKTMYNIEFEEVVEFSNNFKKFVMDHSLNYSEPHFNERKEHWKLNNNFLYNSTLQEKFLDRYSQYEKMLSGRL